MIPVKITTFSFCELYLSGMSSFFPFQHSDLRMKMVLKPLNLLIVISSPMAYKLTLLVSYVHIAQLRTLDVISCIDSPCRGH